MNVRVCVFSFTALLASWLRADTIAVSGHVLDAATSKAVEAVTVSSADGKEPTITASDGKFALDLRSEASLKSRVLVTFDKSGYRPYLKYVDKPYREPLIIYLVPEPPAVKPSLAPKGKSAPPRKTTSSLDDDRLAFFTGQLSAIESPARMAALDALASMGVDASGAARRIATLLQDSNSGVRVKAARTLGRVGELSPAIVNALILALKKPEQDLQCAAAATLGVFGPAAASAAAALESTVDEDGNEEVKLCAGAAWASVIQRVPERLTKLFREYSERERYTSQSTQRRERVLALLATSSPLADSFAVELAKQAVAWNTSPEEKLRPAVAKVVDEMSDAGSSAFARAMAGESFYSTTAFFDAAGAGSAGDWRPKLLIAAFEAAADRTGDCEFYLPARLMSAVKANVLSSRNATELLLKYVMNHRKCLSSSSYRSAFRSFGDDAAPVLRAAVRGERPGDRVIAAAALWPDSDDVVIDILSGALDGDAGDRAIALEAIVAAEPVTNSRIVDALSRNLAAMSAEHMRSALVALTNAPDFRLAGLRAVEQIMFDKNQDDDKRIAAIKAVKRFGVIDAKSAEPLIRLAATSPQGSLIARDAYSELVSFGPIIVNELASRLGEVSNPAGVARILGLLEKIGPPAAAALPSLIPMLKDSNRADAAMRVIAAIGPGAAAARPALAEIIRSKQALVARKIQAIATLATFGASAIPDLTVAARDRNMAIKTAAEEALKKLAQ